MTTGTILFLKEPLIIAFLLNKVFKQEDQQEPGAKIGVSRWTMQTGCAEEPYSDPMDCAESLEAPSVHGLIVEKEIPKSPKSPPGMSEALL